jgi:hypothetical protein
MDERYIKYVLYALIITVVFISGFFIGAWKFKNSLPGDSDTGKINNINNNDHGYQAGWDAAKKRLAEYNKSLMNDGGEIKSLSGTAEKISDNKISLKIRPIGPLDDPDLDQREVIIGSNTKIFKIVEKDAKTYQKEAAEMKEKAKGMKGEEAILSSMLSPSMYEKKEVKVSDIRSGDGLVISSNDNIRNKKEFTAAQIEIQFVYKDTAATNASSSSASQIYEPIAPALP